MGPRARPTTASSCRRFGASTVQQLHLCGAARLTAWSPLCFDAEAAMIWPETLCEELRVVLLIVRWKDEVVMP